MSTIATFSTAFLVGLVVGFVLYLVIESLSIDVELDYDSENYKEKSSNPLKSLPKAYDIPSGTQEYHLEGRDYRGDNKSEGMSNYKLVVKIHKKYHDDELTNLN